MINAITAGSTSEMRMSPAQSQAVMASFAPDAMSFTQPVYTPICPTKPQVPMPEDTGAPFICRRNRHVASGPVTAADALSHSLNTPVIRLLAQLGEGRVTAAFANGTVRDVSAYIRFSAEPLTADDTDFRIVYPYALYHDGERGAGTRCTQPIAVLSLKILPRAVQGDVDGDGRITLSDGDLVYAYHNAACMLTQEQLARADMNGDGKANALDAAMIYAKANKKI